MIIHLPAKIRAFKDNFRHSFDNDTFFGDLFLVNDNGNVIDITGNHKDIVSNSSAITNSYMYLNGSESRIVIKDNKRKFNFGAEDFTIDWWEYSFNELGDAIQVLFNNGAINIKNSDIKLVSMFGNNTDDYLIDNVLMGLVRQNNWCHWAITRSNNFIYLFRNGKITNKFFTDEPLTEAHKNLIIGGQKNSYFYGMLSNFRITKGAALWVENFDLKNELYY